MIAVGNSRRARPVIELLVVAALACVAGWASAGKSVPLLNASAVIAVPGLLAVATLLVLGTRSPMLPFGALLVMFPAGDYLRKMGTGDPRLILVRDLLLVIGVVVLTLKSPPWRDAVTASRAWLVPLGVFVGWFAVAAVNSAVFSSIQVPLVGARLYFEYLPLIGFGWYIAQDRDCLRRAVTFAGIVLCAVTIVGIVHAVLGPTFLPTPNANAEVFTHLDLQRRTIGQTAARVFQPTGLFVEPGRLADWCFVNFALGLALLPHRGGRRWRFVVPIIGALGLFASANRTTIVAALLLSVLVWAHQSRVDSARAVRFGLALTVVIATLAITTRTFFPAQYESRVQFVGRALNFTSSSTEGSQRLPFYARELAGDVKKGGIVGRGAGGQGLGLQYVNGAPAHITEGGWATVMTETGVIGFALWLYWTINAWLFARRVARSLPGEMEQSLSTLSTALAMQLFVIMFISISAIQDMVFNSWLFLVLGVIAGLTTVAAAPIDDANYAGLVHEKQHWVSAK